MDLDSDIFGQRLCIIYNGTGEISKKSKNSRDTCIRQKHVNFSLIEDCQGQIIDLFKEFEFLRVNINPRFLEGSLQKFEGFLYCIVMQLA